MLNTKTRRTPHYLYLIIILNLILLGTKAVYIQIYRFPEIIDF